MIELTAEQQRALDEGNGQPPVVIDRRTDVTYVLVRSEVYERLKPIVPSEPVAPASEIDEIPVGIRRSKAALRRDLPELLANRRTRGKYACYHLEERIGISKDYFGLLNECYGRGIPRSEFIVERIAPGAGEEEIEIETHDV